MHDSVYAPYLGYGTTPTPVQQAHDFVKKGLKLAKEALIADESEKKEEAYRLYVLAIEWLFSGIRDESDEVIKKKVKQQLKNLIERAEILQHDVNRIHKRSSVELPNTDDELSVWEIIEDDTTRKKFSFEGVMVDPKHKSYDMVQVILAGFKIQLAFINSTRDEGQPSALHQITGADFSKWNEYHSITLENGRNATFKEFAPRAFQNIRSMFGVGDVIESFVKNRTLLARKSPGKSPSFFFFSPDYKYIIKLVPNRELDFMKKVLSAYYYYIMQHPNTLLTKYYSFFGVQLEGEQFHHFIIMENVMNVNYDINEVYDLKGSSDGRFATAAEKERPSVILKDLDIRQHHVRITPDDKKLFAEQMKRDCEFLESQDIMDYSLVLGVHHCDPSLYKYDAPEETPEPSLRRSLIVPSSLEQKFVPTWKRDCGGMFSVNHDRIYFMGIIDFLTPYGWKKLMETSWKKMFAEEHEISAVNPTLYRERFEHFILHHCML
eukprot:TRINITY_DN1043_c0_g1_i1.p1 TRINITY_DN1043_c0_g1~~TRINITY_DN1043_c0_g1_i1.p1  ORF type:complete len:492 (+),score=140.84 TRINITY_DN1043_c0_g1_i1:125-1600(+)